MTNRAVALAVVAVALLASGAQGATSANPVFAPSGDVRGWVGAVADFNGDGKPDLAVVNASRIAALLDAGSGRFTAATNAPLAAGVHPFAVASGDFNGDGHADLAVERVDEQTGAGSIAVAFGDGSGGFRSAGATTTAPSTETSTSLRAADLNGDGKLDLIARDRVLLGDGAGKFSAGATLPGFALDVADLNRDKKPDVVVAVGKSISILLGDGNGGFTRAAGSPIAVGRAPVSVATGDFDGNGRPDLAVSTATQTAVLLGDGKGGFHAAAGSPLALGSTGLVAGDFNGDGKADIAAGSKLGVALLLGDGKGGFRTAVALPPPAPQPLAAADLNGDGRTDLVTDAGVLFQTPARPTAARSTSRGKQTTQSTRLPVTALAADGSSVAVSTSSASPCVGNRQMRIVVWRDMRHRPAQIGTRSCALELALGAGRVMWLERACGNSCDLTLRIAPLSGAKPQDLDFVDNGNGAGEDPDGGYIGNLLGGGGTLAFNSWVVCDPNNPDRLGQSCPAKDPATGLATEHLVRVAPGKTAVVKTGAGAYSLAAAGGGRLVVASEGRLSVLGSGGATTCSTVTSAVPPHGVALSTTTLAVEQSLSLDLYDASTCTKSRSLPLGPSAQLRLTGLNAQLALLSGWGRIVLVRLSDGRQIALPQGGVVDAKLTPAGLFYAYDTPKQTLKGRVVFEPTASLLARF